MVLNDITLDDILKNLYSDESRLTFLRKVYTPGNIKVADKILAIREDFSVLESEIEYAKKHGMEDRFIALAKKSVDYHVERGLTNLLEDEVIGWNNPTIADYAITRLVETVRYKSAINIAKHFGKEKRAKTLFERFLKRQLKKKNKYYSSLLAETCVDLGRYKEAIDFYINTGYPGIEDALNIAREHVPERLKEVAQIGFKNYKPDYHRQEIYVECAEILGKTDEAKKTLVKEAKKLQPDRSPVFYESLVKSLVKLGLMEEAKDVVTKVAEYERREASRREYYDLDRQKELARLFEAVGDKASIKDIYLPRIEIGLGSGEIWRPLEILHDIEEGYKLTKDSVFLEKKMRLFEREGKYEEAAKLATELGKHELARTYNMMHQMVEKVKASQQ